MRTGTLRSLKAVVMKQPKVSAAITLSEKAKSELARDSTVFISPLGPAGAAAAARAGRARGRGRKRAAAGKGRARPPRGGRDRRGVGVASREPAQPGRPRPLPALPRFRQELGGTGVGPGSIWRWCRWWHSRVGLPPACRPLCSQGTPSYRGVGICRSAGYLHSYSEV